MDFEQSGKICARCVPALLSCEGEMGRQLVPQPPWEGLWGVGVGHGAGGACTGQPGQAGT